MNKCIICNSTDKQTPYFLKSKISFIKCNKCKLVYTSQEHLQQKNYNDHYCSSFLNNINGEKIPEITAKRLNRIFDKVEKITAKGKMLDIGCQHGRTLRIAKVRGWEVEGIEPFEEIEEYGRKVGIKMYGKELLKCGLPDESYDLVTMTEVIEHLQNPEIDVQEIHRILKKSGIFYITTPNHFSLMRFFLKRDWDIYYHEHLYYFSPGNIKKMLEKEGFKIIEMRCDNFYPKVIMKKYILRLKKRREAKEKKYSHKDYEFREMLEKNKFLNTVKITMNYFLNALKIGSDMKIIAQKK